MLLFLKDIDGGWAQTYIQRWVEREKAHPKKRLAQSILSILNGYFESFYIYRKIHRNAKKQTLSNGFALIGK